MSEAEENLVAWLRDQKMHDSASLVERLRAELAAERESAETYKRTYMELHKMHCGAVAERDALRDQLRRLEEMPDAAERYRARQLLAKSDAALKGDDRENT